MTSSVVADENGAAALEELLRSGPEDGVDAEQRLVVCGVSWGRYLAFDKKLGDDRPDPRLYYLDGELEIMSTSSEHERLKSWIGGFLEDYLLENGIETVTRGQATMRLDLKKAGAEPDLSYCIGQEKEFPDLVLEIALTSGGINKLEVYRRFNVVGIWFWRRNRVEIFRLDSSGQYQQTRTSALLPNLDLALVEHCLTLPTWQQARRAFRDAITKPK
ncbi:MAG: hypothetical protein C5B50_04220 [Verrucomicrobia bacterium]|nr:MAG: hypothetical protein C5B50_04220 [Verrucomicrobiota bacterium]